MTNGVPVTTDFILQILGAKVVELEALRIRLAQTEAHPIPPVPPVDEKSHMNADEIHAALLKKSIKNGTAGLA